MAWITDDGIYVCDACREKSPDAGDERYHGPIEECSVCGEIEYRAGRSCPCVPGADWPECSTHGIVARGGTEAEQIAAVEARDGVSA